MANRVLPSPEYLRQILRYEPKTGRLFWKEQLSNRAPKGSEAFTCTNPLGYRSGRVRGVLIYAHRAVWAICTGRWPDAYIDHIDCNPSNNRIENLREATASQNQHNRRVRKDSASGMKCVHFQKREGSWTSYISVNGKRKHIGYFATKEEAYAAYCELAPKTHGEFARTK